MKQSIAFLTQGTKSANHSKVECKSILIHGIIITLKATLDPIHSPCCYLIGLPSLPHPPLFFLYIICAPTLSHFLFILIAAVKPWCVMQYEVQMTQSSPAPQPQ